MNGHIYIIQDFEGNVVDVYPTFRDAATVFINTYYADVEVLKGVLGEDDFDNDDPFADCDTAPLLTVWKPGKGCIGSYVDPDDVNEALKQGEQYND